MANTKVVISWVLRLIAALIMIQSLFFKFSGADESIYIFTTIGMEPVGRIATGVIELFASVLLLIPRASWLGAITGAGAMSGALFFHLTILGIEVQGDGGQLFFYAVITLLCCVTLLLMERQRLKQMLDSALTR